MLSGGLSRIREVVSVLNKSEQKAAQYILENPQETVEMTVSQLAEVSGTSQSAIIRLCKSLDFKGYQDLKLRVAGDIQDGSHDGQDYQEINPDSDIETIVRSVSNNNIHSISETLKVLDLGALSQTVKLLNSAERIDFYGNGASQLIAQDAQHKFMRVNKQATAYADTHLQLTSAVTLSEKDAAFAISNSGETAQVIESVKAAKKSGATTIGLTRYGNNTLGKLVDVHLQVISTESDIRSAATSSRIVQLNLLDIIYLAIVSSHYDSSIEHLERSRRALVESFHVK